MLVVVVPVQCVSVILSDRFGVGPHHQSGCVHGWDHRSVVIVIAGCFCQHRMGRQKRWFPRTYMQVNAIKCRCFWALWIVEADTFKADFSPQWMGWQGRCGWYAERVFSLSNSEIRPMPPAARCSSFHTSAREPMEPPLISAYRTNSPSVPALIRPAMTSCAPAHNTPTIALNINTMLAAVTHVWM